MTVGITTWLFVLRTSDRTLVPVRVVIIAMMVGVPLCHFVGMLENHHGARSQHVNERDDDDQDTVKNARHFQKPNSGWNNLHDSIRRLWDASEPLICVKKNLR
jgi:hypothetical protein